MQSAEQILQVHNLRDTQPRRLVLRALAEIGKPATHKEVFDVIQSHEATVNLVTVYRTLDTFEELGIVHRHPSSGGIVLCSKSEQKGHHGFLSCQKCGKVEEFIDPNLCKEENRIAQNAGFRPKNHISEILGVCAKCQ